MQHDRHHQHNSTYLCQHPGRWCWWGWEALTAVSGTTPPTYANNPRGGIDEVETGRWASCSSWCNTYLCQHPERWCWWRGDGHRDPGVPDATTPTCGCANILKGGVGDEEIGIEILEFLMQHLPVPTSWKVVFVMKRWALRSWCSWCNTYLCQHPERWCWWQGDRRWDPGVPGEAAAAWCWLSSQCCSHWTVTSCLSTLHAAFLPPPWSSSPCGSPSSAPEKQKGRCDAHDLLCIESSLWKAIIWMKGNPVSLILGVLSHVSTLSTVMLIYYMCSVNQLLLLWKCVKF